MNKSSTCRSPTGYAFSTYLGIKLYFSRYYKIFYNYLRIHTIAANKTSNFFDTSDRITSTDLLALVLTLCTSIKIPLILKGIRNIKICWINWYENCYENNISELYLL